VKTIFLVAFSLINFFVLSEEWTEHLILSSQAYEIRDYETSLFHINLALKDAPESEFTRLKIQKSIVLREAEKYTEAIDCVEKLEKSTVGSFSIQQQIDCAEIKLISYAKLKDADKAQKCFAILKEIDPRLPKFTHTKDYIIIHNYKQIPNYKKIFRCVMIHSQVAEKSDHIKFYENGICIINKTCHCGCEKCEDKQKTFTCDCCGQLITRLTPTSSNNALGCSEYVCNKLEGAGIVFCGSRFKHPGCLLACCAVVYTISEGCKYCCYGGGVYENCIEPFANILDKCPMECEPIW
jgi:tetratricopeptide (TPR) repeat protein